MGTNLGFETEWVQEVRFLGERGKVSKRRALTRGEILSTKITKKCEFWYKKLHKVDTNTGFWL